MTMALERFYATGKRKTAVARVWLTPGSGKVVVNQIDANAYFGGTFKTPKIENPSRSQTIQKNSMSWQP